eukprot:scaffold137231_cov30-Tisochrysis_lutea.AAC.2
MCPPLLELVEPFRDVGGHNWDNRLRDEMTVFLARANRLLLHSRGFSCVTRPAANGELPFAFFVAIQSARETLRGYPLIGDAPTDAEIGLPPAFLAAIQSCRDMLLGDPRCGELPGDAEWPSGAR